MRTRAKVEVRALKTARVRVEVLQHLVRAYLAK